MFFRNGPLKKIKILQKEQPKILAKKAKKIFSLFTRCLIIVPGTIINQKKFITPYYTGSFLNFVKFKTLIKNLFENA